MTSSATHSAARIPRWRSCRLPGRARMLLTGGTYDSVAGGIADDTMNDAVTSAP
jgi:hypothetical protein